MERKTRRVKVVVTVTEPQSPHTQTSFVMEKELESRLTTIELLTCATDAITQLIREKNSIKMVNESFGRMPIGKQSATSSKKESSSKHGAPEYRWVDRDGQSRYTLVHFYNMQPDEEPDKIDYFERDEDAYALLHEKGKVMYIMGDEWRKASLSLI